MKKLILAAAAATVLGLGAFTVPTVAQAQALVNVQYGPPPPPRYENAPPPRRGYVWAPGHWEPRGHRHVWVRGHWERVRPGYRYRAPEWRDHDGRWEMRRGGWDRDGDGVPNRRDSRPDNPYRN